MTNDRPPIAPNCFEFVRPSSARGAVLGKVLVGAVVLVLLGGGAMLLMPKRDQASDDAKADLVQASVQSFEVTATASGELRAKKQTVLRSQLESEATIVQLVEEGSRVKAGDVLVELNADQIQSELDDEMLQRETARAEVVEAESALAIQKTENESTMRKAQTDVQLAELDLQKFEQGDVLEKRLELNLAVEKGNREVDRLTRKVERSRELAKKDFLSQDELEKDELELIEAQAELKKAQVAIAAYEEYTYKKERQKFESDLDQARAELDKTERKNESELSSKVADLTNKKRQLELREDKVKKLEDQLSKTKLIAPTDGLVVYATSLEQFSWMNNQEPLNVGTQIQPNQEIIMLPDTSEMVAAVKVAESVVGRIKPGQPALVTIDAAQGRKYEGKVDSISIMAQSGGWRDPNVREYEVRINLEIEDSAHALKPSMRCEARITLSTVNDVLAVPLQAVFSEGPHQYVFQVEGSQYAQKQVRVGRRSDTMAEIASGIDAGAKVLLREPPAARVVKAKFEEMAGGGRPGGPGSARGGPPAGAGGGKPSAAGQATKPEAKPVKEPAKAEVAAASEPVASDAKADEPTDEASEDETVEGDSAEDESEPADGEGESDPAAADEGQKPAAANP